VTRRHQADTVKFGKLSFRVNDIARLQLAGFDPLADRPLDPLICGFAFMIPASLGFFFHKCK
jgi:hypothetical protein